MQALFLNIHLQKDFHHHIPRKFNPDHKFCNQETNILKIKKKYGGHKT